MTPTADELREVGLRWNPRYEYWRDCGRVSPLCRGLDGQWVPVLGQRTLGEYWRRRRMVEEARRSFEGTVMAMDPDRIPRILASRGWKAWPKPGHKR